MSGGEYLELGDGISDRNNEARDYWSVYRIKLELGTQYLKTSLGRSYRECVSEDVQVSFF